MTYKHISLLKEEFDCKIPSIIVKEEVILDQTNI